MMAVQVDSISIIWKTLYYSSTTLKYYILHFLSHYIYFRIVVTCCSSDLDSTCVF